MATLSISSLATSTTYKVQVRAVTDQGVSEWSPTFSFGTVADQVAPGTPSTPAAFSYLGTIKVIWDGLDALGNAMPKDFNYVEVHSSTINGFTPSGATLVGSSIGAGAWVHTGITYGTAYYYRLIAVDRSGNKSAVPSGQATATPVQVVSNDIFDGAVGSLKLADLAVITAKIADLAVNDAKIGNLSGGKIDAASIQTDKLAVGVIRTNLPANAGFEDTDIPGALGVFTTLPAWTFATNGGTRTPYQEVGTNSVVSPGTGRGKVVLPCTDSTAGTSIVSDAFPLNSGAPYNWNLLVSGWGRLTARLQTSADGVTWTDRPSSMIESADIIGTETLTFTLRNSVIAVSTTNGTLATAFANGSTVDGVVLATGNRLLLAGQTNAAENGLYTVNASGAPTRSTDADATGEIDVGAAVFALSGTVNGNILWYCTDIGDTTSVVTNKAITSNVATITTSAAHGLVTGQRVTVAGVDVTFNGTWIVASTPTTTTFTYSVPVTPNVTSTASSGTVQGAWIAGVFSSWASLPYIHRQVRAATSAPGTLASSFQNGSIIDGVTLVTSDRILIKDQVTASENGIYTVNASGAPTRASEANASGELKVGDSVRVREGINSGGLYLKIISMTSDPWVPGTDSVTWDIVDTYLTISGVYTIPGGTNFGRIVISNSQSIFDSILYVDDVFFMLAGTTGAEITSGGIRLFDKDGSETVRITGAPISGTFINVTGFDPINNVTRTLASISDTGQGTFTSVSTDQLIIAGQDFNSDILGGKTQVIAWGVVSSAQTITNLNEDGIAEVVVDIQAGHLYMIHVSDFIINSAGSSGYYETTLRDGGASSPTSASALVCYGRSGPIGSGFASGGLHRMVRGAAANDYTNNILGAGTHRLLVGLNNQTGGLVTLTGGHTSWVELTVLDLGPGLGDVGVPNSGAGGTTQKKNYVTTWNARWTASYFGSGGKSSTAGDDLVQGYYSSLNGNQKGMISFNGNVSSSGESGVSVTGALAGATVTKVELYLYAYHWYYASGGTAVIGSHGSTAVTAPATWTGTPNRLQIGQWPRGGAKWVSIPNSAIAFASWGSGTVRGIVMGPGPTTSASYYGKFYGATDGSVAPKLRISYTK